MRRACAWLALLAGACARQTRAPQPSSAGSPSHASSAPSTASSSAAPPATIASVAPSDDDGDAIVALPIPPRNQAPDAPSSGWCGETAIQEGLLYLGVFAPQKVIHLAGKPKHPDLYSDEIPVALAALGVEVTTYAPKKRGWRAFSAFVRDALDDGDPVLAGVKILPTEHPDWGLDHFVLVIGHGDDGLWVNTTWGDRRWVADTTTPGLSFANAFYAIRLRRISRPKGTWGARLSVLHEDESTMKLRVECVGAPGDTALRVERRRRVWDAAPEWTLDLATDGAADGVEVNVDARASSRFRCAPR